MRYVKTLTSIRGWAFYSSDMQVQGTTFNRLAWVMDSGISHEAMCRLEDPIYHRNYVRSATSLSLAIMGSRNPRLIPKRIPWQRLLRRKC